MNASPSLLAGTGGEKRARVAALRFSHDNPRTGLSVGTYSQEIALKFPVPLPHHARHRVLHEFAGRGKGIPWAWGGHGPHFRESAHTDGTITYAAPYSRNWRLVSCRLINISVSLSFD